MKRSLTLLLCVAWALSVTAPAQEPVNPDSALMQILRNFPGSKLGLDDAVAVAVRNATTVRQAEAAWLAAEGSLRRERGTFDPEFFFGINHRDDQLPTASFFSGAPVLDTRLTTGNAGLRLDLPIGTRFEATLNTTVLQTNSAFAFLNPQYNSFGALSLRQPLLAGFAASGRKDLNRAEQERDAWHARYRQEALATSADMEQLYWELYAAERNYAVQKLTRDRGEAFLRETELRAKTGIDGPGAVANAKTFLAEQELLLIEREEIVDIISDRIAATMGTRPPDGFTRFTTVDVPREQYPLEDIDSLVAWGITQNLDLLAAEHEVEGFRSLARAAGWEALPQLDLVGTLGGNGLAGTAQDVVFGDDTLRSSRAGNFSDAVSQSLQRDFPSWSIGLELSIPIGLRSGLGEQDRLEAEVMGAEQRRLELARIIEQNIRSSYRELIHGNRRVLVAREGVEAASEQVRIGIIEYRNGRSTAFELVRLGADFAVAQQRYSNALVRTAKAAATLHQLTSGSYPANRKERTE